MQLFVYKVAYNFEGKIGETEFLHGIVFAETYAEAARQLEQIYEYKGSLENCELTPVDYIDRELYVCELSEDEANRIKERVLITF